MKILIWLLNIVQFLIVYFFVYYLFFVGLLEAIDPSLGLKGEGLWPLLSIGIAGIPYKYYNKLSLFILSKKLRNKKTIKVKEEVFKKETKTTSKLKKIFIIIISLTVIVAASYLAFEQYESYMYKLSQNPDSEHFDFTYTPSGNDKTVLVDGLRYFKHDMSLYSGKISGFTNGTSYKDRTQYVEMNYLNGKLNGNYSEWTNYGRWNPGYWLVRAFYKDNKLEGPRKTWFENEQLQSSGFYENGLLQGYYREWDRDGNLIKLWLMNDGEIEDKIVDKP